MELEYQADSCQAFRKRIDGLDMFLFPSVCTSLPWTVLFFICIPQNRVSYLPTTSDPCLAYLCFFILFEFVSPFCILLCVYFVLNFFFAFSVWLLGEVVSNSFFQVSARNRATFLVKTVFDRNSKNHRSLRKLRFWGLRPLCTKSSLSRSNFDWFAVSQVIFSSLLLFNPLYQSIVQSYLFTVDGISFAYYSVVCSIVTTSFLFGVCVILEETTIALLEN